MFKSTLVSKWTPAKIQEIDAAVAEMATDIDRRAKINAPKDTRALVNSAKISRLGVGSYRISFGSSQVAYALRRHFENKKNPQTLEYLSRAGDSVKRSGIKKYLRNI